MKEHWVALQRGDFVPTDILKLMLDSIDRSLPLMQNHPDMGAAKRVMYQDRDQIERMLYWRRLEK